MSVGVKVYMLLKFLLRVGENVHVRKDRLCLLSFGHTVDNENPVYSRNICPELINTLCGVECADIFCVGFFS